jgi:valyl-tRNA synthetase
VWSWWKDGSVHRSRWPSSAEFDGLTGDPDVLEAASRILGEIRRAKSDAKVSMRAEVESVLVTADTALLDQAREAEGDFLAAGRAASVEYTEGEFSVVATLAQDSSS